MTTPRVDQTAIIKTFLLEKLREKRGSSDVSYNCGCCGIGYEWNPDPRYGEYVRWADIEEILK